MSDNLPATRDAAAATIESVVVEGDMSRLNAEQRVLYYKQVCESLGVNPYTKPFDYIKLNGRIVLYARKDATDQLRKLHGVSLEPPQIEYLDDIIQVTITATDRDGRKDAEIGAVSVKGLTGEARANALMKAVTKAKRRATLSIVGLGWLDETELGESFAQPGQVDVVTGEIVDQPKTLAAKSEPRKVDRPADPETVMHWLQGKAEKLDAEHTKASDAQRDAVVAALEKLFTDGDPAVRTAKRRAVTNYVFAKDSTRDLSDGEVIALLRWASEKLDSGEYVPDQNAMQEAVKIVEAHDVEAGQTGLPF